MHCICQSIEDNLYPPNTLGQALTRATRDHILAEHRKKHRHCQGAGQLTASIDITELSCQHWNQVLIQVSAWSWNDIQSSQAHMWD